MIDDTLNNEVVVEQIVVEQPEVEQQVEAASNEQTTPTPEQVQEKEVSTAKNMRALREKSERIERERDAALRQLKEIEAQKTMAQAPVEDDEINIGPDDLAEGKHLSKVSRKIKKLEEQIKGYQQQTTAVSIEAKLKSAYPDFDTVVSKDNIDTLKDSYPEIAQSLSESQDMYSKAVSAYTLIKKLGIHVEDLYSADRAMAQKNATKPKPLASVAPQQGDSPLSRANAFANGLTEELKVQLRKEMEESRKNR